MTQLQMFYKAQKNSHELDITFLELVEDGLTRDELQQNINRRPSLWGRFSNWLDKLP